jgi:hypothetical protein
MQKVFGATQRQDGLYLIGRKKWELIYGYGVENDMGYNWRKRYSGTKPTAEEVIADIKSVINSETDKAILEGFKWRGTAIWLSAENQFNYKAAYDLAVQSAGATLPVTFKFGTDDAPEYYQFKTLDDLTDFYTAAISYISQTLQKGWDEKEQIDFDTLDIDE